MFCLQFFGGLLGKNKMPSVTLPTGQKQPLVGLGTFLANNKDELRQALFAALDAGYRLIDTATMYQNEADIGDALEEYFNTGKLKREDIFLVSKLFFTDHRPDLAEQGIKNSLKWLKTTYLDLYLIHVPFSLQGDGKGGLKTDANGVGYAEPTPIIDTWRVLEKFHQSGQLKAIGVSNFNIRQLHDLHRKAAVKPMNHQLELHIFCPQPELVKVSKELGMTVTSYATMGSRERPKGKPFVAGDVLTNPVVLDIAKKHGKTTGQVVLRHQVQQGICVIPKSTSPQRIRENFDIFSFQLDKDDMAKLDGIKDRVKFYVMPFGLRSPEFSFGEWRYLLSDEFRKY